MTIRAVLVGLIVASAPGCKTPQSVSDGESKLGGSEAQMKGEQLLVAIEGYGIRLWLKPPFQAGRLPPGPQGIPDQFVCAHLDGPGVKNLLILPVGPEAGKLADIREITAPMRGFQIGDGTRVIMGENVEHLRDVGVLELGPSEAGWFIVSERKREAWSVGKIVESAEPPVGYILRDQPGTFAH